MHQNEKKLKSILAMLTVLVIATGCIDSRCHAQQVPSGTDSQTHPPQITILQLSDGHESLTTRQASFLLGQNLAYLIALKSRGYPEEKLAATYSAVEGLSKALQIEVPELPRIEGLADFGTATRFLLKDEECVVSQLLEKQGAECAGMFALAANLMLTPTIYAASVHSDAIKKLCDAMLQDIEQAYMDANFKHKEDSRKAVKTYCDWIRDGKPAGSELSKTMQDSYAQLESLLKAELVEDEVLRAVKKARGEAAAKAANRNGDDSKAP